MKLSLQYLNDNKGNISAVQLPVTEWEKIVDKIKKYEQLLKIKSDLIEAFADVKKMQKSKAKKQTVTKQRSSYKAKVLEGLKEAVDQVNLAKQGKVKLKSARPVAE